MRSYELAPEAADDITEAWLWYEDQRIGLGVYYELTETVILVVAVLHASRGPGVWSSPLRE